MSLIQVPPPPIPVIVLGEDKTLDIKLVDQDGNPVDVSAATAIVAILANADGLTYLEASLANSGVAIINGGGGHIQMIITAAQSALLAVGQSVAIDLRLTIATKLFKVIIPDAVQISAAAYPAAP